MSRFFVSKETMSGEIFSISGEDARHISKVLRMCVSDRITVGDGEGMDCLCEILELTKDQIRVKIIERQPNMAEPSISAVLFQALPKQGKMEVIIQKCTELGVQRVVPFYSKFCVAKPADKTQRWQKVAYEAAKQCGRGRIPVVEDCVSFQQAVMRLGGLDAGIFCYEGDGGVSLKSALSMPFGSVGIMIGSEGGFDEDEVRMLQNQEMIRTVSLGQRILRTETAGMAVLSAVMYQTDNI